MRALVALTLAVAIALGVTGCSGGDEDTGPTTTAEADTTTTTTPGPPPDAEIVPITDLDEGACFDQVEDEAARPYVVLAFDCASPHQYEVYSFTFYDGEGSGRRSPYPGDNFVRDWAEQFCYDGFRGFIGVPWTASQFELDLWWPSAESWIRGDRKVVCAVTDRAGASLTGSARGSLR